MLRITGTNLTLEDRRFLRQAAKFVLAKLHPDSNLYINAKIHLVIRDFTKAKGHHREDRGECDYDPKKKSVVIRLHEKLINPNPDKRIWSRHYNLLHYFFHECVHVKQYFTGELQDRPNENKYVYKGKLRKVPSDDDLEAYYNQDFEIEAYGRTEGLVIGFYKHWKESLK